MPRYALQVLFLLALLMIIGCGEAVRKSAPTSADAYPSRAGESTATRGEAGPPASGIGGKEVAVASNAPAPGANRKIIFTARIESVVENFDNIPTKLAELVKQADGYVADSSLSGSTGRNRSGTWKIRVPVVRFDEFVNQAKGIGELVSANTQSQDVSEEYYDVDARIRNKTKEEERLLKLLDDRPAKLEEVLTVERELSRVREEIERMQGRMRVLTDQTSLTTVEITIREMQNYEPPQSPTFLTRVGRAFLGSTSGIKSTFEWIVILSAKLIPWLFAIALAIWLFFAVLRIVSRRW
ncbi:MAG TPA: DUF4349 domain-containing protein [Pirellulales bacterium]|jgi:hypothetical protein